MLLQSLDLRVADALAQLGYAIFKNDRWLDVIALRAAPHLDNPSEPIRASLGRLSEMGVVTVRDREVYARHGQIYRSLSDLQEIGADRHARRCTVEEVVLNRERYDEIRPECVARGHDLFSHA